MAIASGLTSAVWADHLGAWMASSSSFLAPVRDLSDDELPKTDRPVLVPHPEPKRRPAQRRPTAKRKKPQSFMTARTLRYRVNGSCGCQCKCFEPLKHMTVFANLLKIHTTLASMDKCEQDKYVNTSLTQHTEC